MVYLTTTFVLLAIAVKLTVSSPIQSRQLPGTANNKPKLTFDASGNFKVVSFSDMHFGERNGDGTWAIWGDQNDAATQNVHSVVLDQEHPNYVVFNGDMVTGENLFASNATNYLDKCFAPTVQRNIPFSTTQGNHDNANNINHKTVIDYEQAHYSSLSYTRSDVGPSPYGLGNYWVPVYSNSAASKPSLIMWFFDSRSFVSGTGNGPGPVPDDANFYWVDDKTVPPYIDSQRQAMIKAWGAVPPSIVFVHIPLSQAQSLWSVSAPGDHDDGPNMSVQGFLGSNYTGLDQPFFQALERIDGGATSGKVLAVVSGHDHGDSWCARSSDSGNIPICFNGHSGHGGYVTTNSAVRNGRVFQFNLAKLGTPVPSVDTWNSYEDKTTNERVTLNRS